MLSQNLLQLNKKTSDMISFNPPKFILILLKNVGFFSSNIQYAARNLRVIFDSDLSFIKTNYECLTVVFVSVDELFKGQIFSVSA